MGVLGEWLKTKTLIQTTRVSNLCRDFFSFLLIS